MTQMTNAADRNRQIKKLLSAAFPGRKVTVCGSRGTAYGYASVRIDFTPLDADQRTELRGLCFQLLAKASVDVGSRYTDDTCQYTCPEVSIDFNTPRFYRTQKHQDGTMSVLHHYSDEWVSA